MLFNHRFAIAALVISLPPPRQAWRRITTGRPAVFTIRANRPPAAIAAGPTPRSRRALRAKSAVEGRIRDMTGQIEELQNANRKLVEQVQKFQADVEFRLQDKGGHPVKRTEAAPLPGETGPAMDADAAPPAAAKPAPLKTGRTDSLRPDAAPSAPGAPKALGSTTPSAPEDAPLESRGRRTRACRRQPWRAGAHFGAALFLARRRPAGR